MTEPIEKWREEFYEEMAKLNPVKFTFSGDAPIVEHRSGKSAQLVVGIAWQIFIAAKRSQPVVELVPEYVSKPGYYYKIAATESELNKAGIPYKIKGE